MQAAFLGAPTNPRPGTIRETLRPEKGVALRVSRAPLPHHPTFPRQRLAFQRLFQVTPVTRSAISIAQVRRNVARHPSRWLAVGKSSNNNARQTANAPLALMGNAAPAWLPKWTGLAGRTLLRFRQRLPVHARIHAGPTMIVQQDLSAIAPRVARGFASARRAAVTPIVVTAAVKCRASTMVAASSMRWRASQRMQLVVRMRTAIKAHAAHSRVVMAQLAGDAGPSGV